MSNHNLTATMDDGTTTTVDTIREARAWAESHGSTARHCCIYSGLRMVAMHRRSAEGDGTRWYRVFIHQA